MGGPLPKQFLKISGKPVIFHTIEIFSPTDKMILVLPQDFIGTWKEICSEYDNVRDHFVVSGGETRFHSVRNGLESLGSESELVAIHDAARPLTTRELAEKAFREAAIHGSAIPVIPVNDTIRELEAETSRIVPRQKLRIVQTPQVFSREVITSAYRSEFNPSFTDDAAILESMGMRVNYFRGENQNLKITFPEDLVIAEAILNHRKSQFRP